jgi:hypothetical protein
MDLQKITLLDVKNQTLEYFKNTLQPEMSGNYPLFSFALTSIQHAFLLYSGLQKEFTKAGWLNGGIDEIILKPYFLLEQDCNKVPYEAVLLKYPDKAKNVWVIRNDRFLPKEWPQQIDTRFFSMAHATISFVIETYAKASKAFEKVDISSVIIRPKPSKELWNLLERLYGIVPNYYKDIDFDNLLKDVHREIENEYGLYAKAQSASSKATQAKRKKGERGYIIIARHVRANQILQKTPNISCVTLGAELGCSPSTAHRTKKQWEKKKRCGVLPPKGITATNQTEIENIFDVKDIIARTPPKKILFTVMNKLKVSKVEAENLIEQAVYSSPSQAAQTLSRRKT